VRERVLAGLTIQARQALRASVAELAHRVAAPDVVVARILRGAGIPGAPWAVDVLRRAADAALTDGRERDTVELVKTALGADLAPADRANLLVTLAAAVVMESPDASDRALAQAITGSAGRDTDGTALAAADLLIARGSADIAGRAIRTRLDRRRRSGTDAGRAALAAMHASALGCLRAPQAECPQRVPELPDQPDDPLVAGIEARRIAARGTDLERATTLAKIALAASFAEQPLTTPRVDACTALMLADQVDEAEAGLTTVVHEARRRRLRAPAADALLISAVLALHRGRLDEASASVAAAIDELPLPSWHPLTRPFPLACKAIIELRRGDLAAAERTIDSIVPTGAERGFAWSYLLFARGAYALATGDPAAALADLTECGRRRTARQWHNPALVRWRPLAAAALCELGEDTEQARRLLADDLRAATAWGTSSAIGGAYLAAGLIVDDAAAPERIAKAERLLRESPARLLHAEALTAQAMIELGRSAPGGAFTLLEQAITISYELGTAPLAPHHRQRQHGGARPREPDGVIFKADSG
jgi:tetratricopeptide (TPR) repeat protein